MEGLDVLYSTNTVHIGSLVLSRHLPLLLPPQRLASITSLELIWDLVLFRPLHSPEAEQENGFPAYNALVRLVASAFPCLRKLYISIQTGSHVADPSADHVESDEQKLLGPIDELVRKIGPQLRDCQIAPPRSLHAALMSRAESAGTRIDSGGQAGLSWTRFWRPVTVEKGEQSENEIGYWVRQGMDDTPLSCFCCYIF